MGAPNQVSDIAFLMREVFFDKLQAFFLHTLIQTDRCGMIRQLQSAACKISFGNGLSMVLDLKNPEAA